MQRITQLPLTLYRIQAKLPVNLRSYENQIKLGRTSFDLKLHNGLYMPVKEGSPFTTPNGFSLRPASQKMIQILDSFNGNPTIYSFLTGMKLPDGFCIYHEHTDHYSLQTTEPISLEDYNRKVTELLMTLPTMTKQNFLDMMNDDDDRDV